MNDSVSLLHESVIKVTRVTHDTDYEVLVPRSPWLTIFETIVDAEWVVANVANHPHEIGVIQAFDYSLSVSLWGSVTNLVVTHYATHADVENIPFAQVVHAVMIS